MDPPYNHRQYATNYHLLETIAKYDNPKIHGKTGLRDYQSQKSLYCSRTQAREAFKDLILKAKGQKGKGSGERPQHQSLRLVLGKNFCPFAIQFRAFPQFCDSRIAKTEKFSLLLKEKNGGRKKLKKCIEKYIPLLFSYFLC